MSIHRLYGLRMESALPFPELPGGSGESGSPGSNGSPDVVLTRERLVSPRPTAGAGEPAWFGVDGDACWFDWPGLATVRVARGRQIAIDPADGATDDALRAALLGPVASVLLLQRGLLPLHASVVSIGGRAIAFAGASGEGKSSLADALERRGHAVVADDVAAIRLEPTPLEVQPGFPHLKLAPDLLEQTGERWHDYPRANPREVKRLRPVASFRSRPLPLGRVYVLEEGRDRFEGPLPRHRSLFLALRNVHRAPLLERVVGHAELLRRCGRLAANVPFFVLSRPRDLARLGDLALRVEEHAA